jgi:lipopolysaccharide/colanic/teichoic acid biosynthesis glycosyltransferase
MALSDLWTRLAAIAARGRRDRWLRLDPPRRFARVLRRERARTDRGGDGFSLLAFRQGPGESRRGVLHHLAETLRRRLRVTDEAGWLDAHRIGVVLPATPVVGARKLADDLLVLLGEDARRVVCTIHAYPSDQFGFGFGFGEHSARPAEAAEPLEPLLIERLPPWKRAVDVFGAIAGLILLSPLLAAAAVAIKLTSPGPVLFRQRRSGLGSRPFLMYKLRTMVPGAEVKEHELRALSEQDGPAFKIRRDPRVTRAGRWLRATGIDELPQLWNVLKGEMSLVGPRPLPCRQMADCSAWHRRRLDVTPGLTCIWQVRREPRVAFADWMRMDLRYIGRRSLAYDLWLMLATVPAMIRRKGC